MDAVTVQQVAAFQGNAELSNWLLYRGAWKNRFSIDDAMPKARVDAEGGAESGAEAQSPREAKEEEAGGAAAAEEKPATAYGTEAAPLP
eukprot:NODE_17568_length_936_cov_5.515451.p4 GENE.NODE_17568_length_936_cov_5.515451~~NODE_17568_length_936_cov_5.515451.p4  ORF type:complete len:89 (-),score=39.35 NODE_17568_length_936_cov_5.515451:113-379(-)